MLKWLINRKAFLLRGIACHLKDILCKTYAKSIYNAVIIIEKICFLTPTSCFVHFYECKSSSWQDDQGRRYFRAQKWSIDQCCTCPEYHTSNAISSVCGTALNSATCSVKATAQTQPGLADHFTVGPVVNVSAVLRVPVPLKHFL